MKTLWILFAMLLCTGLKNYAQPSRQNFLNISGSDTAVCIPILQAQLIAYDLEHYDRLKVQLNITENLLEAKNADLQKADDQISIMQRDRELITNQLKEQGVLITDLNTLTEKRTNQRNIAGGLAILLFIGILIK